MESSSLAKSLSFFVLNYSETSLFMAQNWEFYFVTVELQIKNFVFEKIWWELQLDFQYTLMLICKGKGRINYEGQFQINSPYSLSSRAYTELNHLNHNSFEGETTKKAITYTLKIDIQELRYSDRTSLFFVFSYPSVIRKRVSDLIQDRKSGSIVL